MSDENGWSNKTTEDSQNGHKNDEGPTTTSQSELPKESNTSQADASEDGPATVEAEVVDGRSLQPSQGVESLSTFSEREGPFSYKIIPVIRNRGSDWRVNVYMRGTQGPVYQSSEGVTDEAADRLGMSRRLQDRINNALAYAEENLQLPSELGNQKRDKRSLHELEVMMEDGE